MILMIKRTLKQSINLLNSLLSPLGVRIVKDSAAFDMPLAIQRIAAHDILIGTVIDIGASDGKWSINSMKTFPKASFLAIEALAERQNELESVKQRYKNFDYCICVAGDRDGEIATLNVSEDLDGSTVDGSRGRSREVTARTIDALIAEKNLSGPFLLKFDTHGYELPILLGAKETLANTNAIVMEVYNFKITEHALRFHEMCAYMEELGFRCYDIAEPMLRIYDRAFWQMDILFARSDAKIFSYLEYK
jgi:FkbM family methyltransferase